MASAWFEEDVDFEKKLSENGFIKTNGLISGLQPTTNITEMLALFKELFEFKHIGLYRVSQTEAFFEVSKLGNR